MHPEHIWCCFERHAFCAVFPILHQLGDDPLRAAQWISVCRFARDFAGEDERAYWVHPTDFHPNGRAHRLAAEYLLKTLAW